MTCVVEITTVCNRKCPECCCGMRYRPPVHHDWGYFERLAELVCGVDRIHITGGEPAVHPHFDEIAQRFRGLFQCRSLTVWTNGFRAREHAAAWGCFDTIYASRYGDNDAEVDYLVRHFQVELWQGEHTPRTRRGSGKPCQRGIPAEMVTYSDGRFYPCCVGPGIRGAPSLQPCVDWREKILSVPLPCGDCWFSPQ